MKTQMDTKATLKYNSLNSALNVASRCKKLMMVVLGDDGLFWLVTPAEAERMQRAGYQIARW